jgi:hypothetical protein
MSFVLLSYFLFFGTRTMERKDGKYESNTKVITPILEKWGAHRIAPLGWGAQWIAPRAPIAPRGAH